MITRAQIRRQLRKNGGVMNAVPRQQYGLGSIFKSITKPITFTAIVDLDSDVKSATGTMQFNRADFGVQYRTEMHLDDAKSFWNSATTTKEALKDKVIKDEIDIKFNIISVPGLLER